MIPGSHLPGPAAAAQWLARGVLLALCVAPTARAEPAPAWRVELEYHRGAVHLGRVEPVVKTLAPGDPGLLPTDTDPPGAAGATPQAREGFWFEVRSPGGTVLYRRAFQDPAFEYWEPAASRRAGRIARVEHERSRAVFSILVPQIADGELVVFGPRRSARRGVKARDAGPEGPAQELARFPLAARLPGEDGP
jgi:hypothetical protein